MDGKGVWYFGLCMCILSGLAGMIIIDLDVILAELGSAADYKRNSALSTGGYEYW